MARFKEGDEVVFNTDEFAEMGLKSKTKYIVQRVIGKTRVILEGHQKHLIHEKWLKLTKEAE